MWCPSLFLPTCPNLLTSKIPLKLTPHHPPPHPMIPLLHQDSIPTNTHTYIDTVTDSCYFLCLPRHTYLGPGQRRPESPPFGLLQKRGLFPPPQPQPGSATGPPGGWGRRQGDLGGRAGTGLGFFECPGFDIFRVLFWEAVMVGVFDGVVQSLIILEIRYSY